MVASGFQVTSLRVADTRQAASQLTAELISSNLVRQLESRDRASLVLSGGSTPVSCLKTLSTVKIPWWRVDVTLTDERDVPADDPASNERMLRETLMVADASECQFIPLVEGAIRPLQPFSSVLVGMGEDGHFASLFPDSPQLEEGLNSTDEILRVSTPSSPYARVSMTLNTITDTDLVILLIFGDSKRQIVENPSGLPVNELLLKKQVTIIWAA